uniref:Uncharacterized protein n=1 Tax=Bionectria ochroleuca TaxID=29856 RepID=A0A8H7NPP1_BIOOC
MGARTLSSSPEPADLVSNPPSKNEACAYYCGRKRLPQIQRTNMKLHFQNAYGHELDLLQTFRDRIARLSLEASRVLIPPVTMQQHPIHYSIQLLLPPPQQQPLPPTAISYGQMGFQGQYQTGAWPSQVTHGHNFIPRYTASHVSPDEDSGILSRLPMTDSRIEPLQLTTPSETPRNAIVTAKKMLAPRQGAPQ